MSAGREIIDGTLPLYEQVEQLQRIVEEKNVNPPVLFILPDGNIGKILKSEREGYRGAPLNVDGLNSELTRWITYVAAPRGKNDTGERSSLSKELVQAYMNSTGFPGVPTVRRLGRAPVIGEDLSVAWDVGYAPASQVFITEGMDRRLIGEARSTTDLGIVIGSEGVTSIAPRTVDAEMARRAGKYLMSWFTPFAFVNPDAAADCLGLALTPMLMSYIKGPIPGGVFIANKEGSGKTTCAQMVSILATGSETAPSTWPSISQMRNTVTSMLKSSSTVGLFDNVKTDLDNDALESLLTSRQWQERKFHSQDNMTLPNDTLWMFTKNSPSLSPDMLRRLVLVSLDRFRSKAKWDKTIIRRALQEEDKIRSAMVTLVMYWRSLGTPSGNAEPFVGFEEWSEAISGILESAGIAGFGLARDSDVSTVYTEDDDAADMVGRIYEVMGTSPWTGKDLWDTVNQAWAESVEDPMWKDKNAIFKWLSTGVKNPVMSVGKRISALNGKEMKGTNLVVRRLDGQRAKFIVEVRSSGVVKGYRGLVDLAD